MPTYTKPPLTYEQQLGLLRDRGLRVDRPREARQVLRTVGYSRLTTYWLPLFEPGRVGERFRAGATFSDAYARYQLDSRLRRIVLYCTDHIEVALRARVAYEASHFYGTGHWLLRPEAYRDYGKALQTVSAVLDSFGQSRDGFAREYREVYAEQSPVPPAWLALEVLTFDRLARLFINLREGAIRRAVADDFDLPDQVLLSWLRSLQSLRNIAAHHGRLWNRALLKEPRWPNRFEHARYAWVAQWQREGESVKFYAGLCCMAWLIDEINPRNTLRGRLDEAIAAIDGPLRRALQAEMGFPDDWRVQPLWSK